MNPNESRSETNGARVRMFASDDLVASTMAQSWDRVKVICQQPFNKQLAFGLAFIRIIEAKSETAEGPNDNKGTSATVLQPKNQLTLGRFALRAEPNSDTGSNLSPGAMFMKKQMSKDAPEEDSNSASAIRNAPQPQPSIPSTFMELSSKRKKSPEPKPKAKRQASDVASSSAAKVPRQKSPSRTTPQPRGEGKQKAPPQPSPSPSMPTVPTTPVAPKVAPKAVTKLKRAPFDQLLSGVTFAMSGFVNPLRAQLREKALELGGKYKPDWQPGCTHLICAFANTPKFNQVRGRGKIVKKEWIEDCHSRRRRLPWRRYALDRADQGRAESEDEIEADDGGVANTSSADASSAAASTEPVNSASESPRPVVQFWKHAVRLELKNDPDFKLDAADGSSTDVDSEASNTDDEIDQIRTGKKSKERPNRREQKKKDDGGQTGASGESPTKGNVDANGLPLLPDFFAGKHFFIFGKMLTADERRQ
uniref:BRCT domain-containing protein n=1 Tax=Plectus sambesii TaxID=2011161 RepID=A0A914UXJ9_9BILA